jgi:hypothetical protein
MATAVAEGTQPGQQVSAHFSGCPGCEAEFDQLRRTWVLCGTWIDTEPPTHLDRAILAEVSAATETRSAWLGRLASVRVWATAAVAAALAIASSILVPYQDSLRLCDRIFADAGFPIPSLLLALLVGLPYAFLPLLGVLLLWVHLKGNSHKMQTLTAGQVFAVIMVPYIFFTCLDLEVTMIAGILLGTMAGALLAGMVGQRLIRQWPASAAA